jgi:hypothetical protein
MREIFMSGSMRGLSPFLPDNGVTSSPRLSGDRLKKAPMNGA